MAEKIYSKGSLFSIPDLRDYKATTTVQEFPDSFELEMPEVKNQRNIGSCVAHSLALVAEYFNTKETNTELKMSTGYIYGNRLLSSYKGSGMYTRDALKTMTKFGDVSHEKFPENVEVPEAIELFDSKVDELQDEGLNYKFDSYFKLNDEAAIKAHLLDGNPVIMSMYWYDDIKIVKGIMQTELVKSESTGGHCMVIYGWNSDGWLIQNSWGKSWGKKGRFVMPYSIPMKESWGVTDAKSNVTLDIEKPFKSKIGAFFAKIIHKIIRWFYSFKKQ